MNYDNKPIEKVVLEPTVITTGEHQILDFDSIGEIRDLSQQASDRLEALDILLSRENIDTFDTLFTDDVSEDIKDEAYDLLDMLDLDDALIDEIIGEDKEIQALALDDAIGQLVNNKEVLYSPVVLEWNAFNPENQITHEAIELDEATGVFKTKAECKKGGFDRRKQECVETSTTKMGGVRKAFKRKTLDGKKFKMTAKQKANAKRLGKKHKSSSVYKKAAKAREAGKKD